MLVSSSVTKSCSDVNFLSAKPLIKMGKAVGALQTCLSQLGPAWCDTGHSSTDVACRAGLPLTQALETELFQNYFQLSPTCC